MSDPTPREGETEAGAESETEAANDEAGQASTLSLPSVELPEELLQKRLGRLDTRRALAELCKSMPGLEERLLPPGIQADALTRKAGSRAQLLKGISRRVSQDITAWAAFHTAISEQIPPETHEAVEELTLDNLQEAAEAHTLEGLIFAALTAEEEPDQEVMEGLVSAWREESQQAEQQASEDARITELEQRVEQLQQEKEQLSFSSRTANERASALTEEIETLKSERDEAATRATETEQRASAALQEREQLGERIAELEQHNSRLERALTGERSSYSEAAERVESLHTELERVSAERDRIQNALDNARFTDSGFSDLLVRAVKNEVSALPDSPDNAARTARLLDFMSQMLQAQAELREPRSPSGGGATQEEDEEDSEPSLSLPDEEPDELANGAAPAIDTHPRPRPTLSFRALGGSSHLLDLGGARVLVDAGIKPDGKGASGPDFKALDGLDAAVITHAHLDHCGALPQLVRDRPELPIYCTPPSAKLITSALNDHAAMGGTLGGASIHEVGRRLIPVPFGKPFKVGDARVTLTESGHILGAASVLVESGEAKVFHTGDICMEDHFSIPSARLPEVSDIDMLIMEATLADRRPQPFSESIEKMVEVINDTVLEREGSVLIPTYALGQAQEIILGLKHYGEEYGLDPDVFIYVDGSVVTTSEKLYAGQLGYMKPYLQQSDPRELFTSENIRAVSNDDKARERILANPCAIIASPVTMQGGQSGFYRERLQKSRKNAVILPSNAASAYGTGQAAGEEEEWRVERVSFAAHCTQDELLDITERLSPRQVVLIHGSKRKISDLAARLAPEHKIHTPAAGETVRTVL